MVAKMSEERVIKMQHVAHFVSKLVINVFDLLTKCFMSMNVQHFCRVKVN